MPELARILDNRRLVLDHRVGRPRTILNVLLEFAVELLLAQKTTGGEQS